MKRIDRLLVDRGLAESRTHAQTLIDAGRVFVIRDGRSTQVTKASESFEDDPSLEIEIRPSAEPEYVSRGGLKLLGALRHLDLDVQGFWALDVGISTGGFTDCLLQAGAERVVGVDVGHGQLAAKLQGDPRVTLLEGINARDLPKAQLLKFTDGRKFDLIVVDVSFISLRLVLPAILDDLKDQHRVLALVKPQFEVGREGLGKNGIVKDTALFEDVRRSILKLCEELGLSVEDYFASSIEGADGNKEFFVFARKG